MTQAYTITANNLAKLLRAGYSIYRIPPDYKKVIHYLKFGKWGPKWETYQYYKNANEADAEMIELLKTDKTLQVK